jgi:hypothetical protein
MPMSRNTSEIDVVVDDENAAARRRRGATRCRGLPMRPGGGRVRDVRHRQERDELASGIRPVASRFDAAAVHLDQPLDDREPDAEAAAALVERCVELREHLEHAAQHVPRQADAVVLHRHGCFAAVA